MNPENTMLRKKKNPTCQTREQILSEFIMENAQTRLPEAGDREERAAAAYFIYSLSV